MSAAPVSVTVYFVGVDADDALRTFPFDSYESASDYQQDNPGTKVYSAEAVVRLDTWQQVID